MKLTYLSLLASSAFAATTCNALTIDAATVYGFDTEVTISDAAGTPLPAGNRILIGTFDTSSAATPAEFFEANKSNVEALMSHFTGVSTKNTLLGLSDRDWTFGLSFNTEHLNTPDVVAAGCFALEIGLTSEDSALEGKKAYLVVFKTTDNSTNFGPHYWNVSEVGVFSSTNTSEWTFLSDKGNPMAKITLLTNDVDQFYVSNGSALKTYACGPVHPGALWGSSNGTAQDISSSWYGNVWPLQYGNGWFVSASNAAWQYAVSGSDGVWIYDFTLGWTWTKELYYPYIYLYDIGQWVYFYGMTEGVRFYCVFDPSLAPSLANYPYATDEDLAR